MINKNKPEINDNDELQNVLNHNETRGGSNKILTDFVLDCVWGYVHIKVDNHEPVLIGDNIIL